MLRYETLWALCADVLNGVFALFLSHLAFCHQARHGRIHCLRWTTTLLCGSCVQSRTNARMYGHCCTRFVCSHGS